MNPLFSYLLTNLYRHHKKIAFIPYNVKDLGPAKVSVGMFYKILVRYIEGTFLLHAPVVQPRIQSPQASWPTVGRQVRLWEKNLLLASPQWLCLLLALFYYRNPAVRKFQWQSLLLATNYWPKSTRTFLLVRDCLLYWIKQS